MVTRKSPPAFTVQAYFKGKLRKTYTYRKAHVARSRFNRLKKEFPPTWTFSLNAISYE